MEHMIEPEKVFFKGMVQWAQVDMNRHMRHSAYADFGAQARIIMLEKLGLPEKEFVKHAIGPILFREETLYKREVKLNEQLTITCELNKSKQDASRWSLTHHIIKENGIIAAIIHADGAWIDMKKRKLASLPIEIANKFNQIPKSNEFVWLD